jgi:hypothetical protein
MDANDLRAEDGCRLPAMRDPEWLAARYGHS